VGYPKSNI
jgi:hypothetical protein